MLTLVVYQVFRNVIVIGVGKVFVCLVFWVMCLENRVVPWSFFRQYWRVEAVIVNLKQLLHRCAPRTLDRIAAPMLL